MECYTWLNLFFFLNSFITPWNRVLLKKLSHSASEENIIVVKIQISILFLHSIFCSFCPRRNILSFVTSCMWMHNFNTGSFAAFSYLKENRFMQLQWNIILCECIMLKDKDGNLTVPCIRKFMNSKQRRFSSSEMVQLTANSTSVLQTHSFSQISFLRLCVVIARRPYTV
jgi:hypothetical protein